MVTTTRPGGIAAGEALGLGVSLVLSALVLDLALSAGTGRWFDAGLLASCLLLAALVRHGDFFAVGVAPPLLLAGTLLVAAVGSSGAAALGTTVDALGAHSGALLATWGLTLLVLAVRHQGAPAPG